MQIKLSQAEKEYNLVAKELQICIQEYEYLLSEFNQMNETRAKLENLIEQCKIKLY